MAGGCVARGASGRSAFALLSPQPHPSPLPILPPLRRPLRAAGVSCKQRPERPKLTDQGAPSGNATTPAEPPPKRPAGPGDAQADGAAGGQPSAKGLRRQNRRVLQAAAAHSATAPAGEGTAAGGAAAANASAEPAAANKTGGENGTAPEQGGAGAGSSPGASSSGSANTTGAEANASAPAAPLPQQNATGATNGSAAAQAGAAGNGSTGGAAPAPLAGGASVGGDEGASSPLMTPNPAHSGKLPPRGWLAPGMPEGFQPPPSASMPAWVQVRASIHPERGLGGFCRRGGRWRVPAPPPPHALAREDGESARPR